MSALLIGPEERERLQRIRRMAAEAPVDVRALQERMKSAQGSLAHRHQMTEQSMLLPTSFHVTFSVETGHPVGTCRHMSMSSTVQGRFPIMEALWMVAEELGFVGGINHCKIWTEQLSDGGMAVNVVQPVDLWVPAPGSVS